MDDGTVTSRTAWGGEDQVAEIHNGSTEKIKAYYWYLM
jgi:hypothetical protein